MKKVLIVLVVAILTAALILVAVQSESLTDMLTGASELEEYTVPVSGSGTGFYRHKYEALDDVSKQAYALILQSIEDHPAMIRVPELNEIQLNAVFEALSYDNPSLLCLGSGCKLLSKGLNHYFVPEYAESYEECSKHKAQLMSTAVDIKDAAAKLADEYERELYVHDYIVDKCVYTDSALSSVSSAYGALCLGTATCEGYARGFQLVLSLLSIDNMLVTGRAQDSANESQGHMWNLAMINGNWYYVDLTWDDPVSDNHVVGHAYFNVSGDMIRTTHTEITPSDIVCSAVADNYFVRNELFFTDASVGFEAKFLTAVARAYSAGDSSIEVRFTDAVVYEQAKQKMLEKGLVRTAFELSSIIRANEGFTMNYSENAEACTFRLFLR